MGKIEPLIESLLNCWIVAAWWREKGPSKSRRAVDRHGKTDLGRDRVLNSAAMGARSAWKCSGRQHGVSGEGVTNNVT